MNTIYFISLEISRVKLHSLVIVDSEKILKLLFHYMLDKELNENEFLNQHIMLTLHCVPDSFIQQSIR